MAFEDLASELAGKIPGFSIYLAEKAIARAWQRILRERTWSFLIGEGAFNAPVLISAGSVTLTQYSANVVVDATADAALNGLANPLITARQFRIGSAGGIYNILSYTHATKTLVVDRPILESSGAGQGYQVYQCYFPPPPQALLASGIYDFNRWISVLDPVNGYTLDVEKDKAWLDRRDPQRTDQNLAYVIVEYKADSNNNMLWEFWPHPTAGQEFIVLYKKKGFAVLTGAETIPDIISEDLIVTRALIREGYPWAAMNAGRDPALGKVNWTALTQLAQGDYKDDLQKAKLEDSNVNLQELLPSLSRWSSVGPIDATFIAGHDMLTQPRGGG